jgi:acetamidase/formamidase
MTPPAHRHTIHQRHHGWDHSIAAVTHIAPGESLEFDVADASGDQLGAASGVDVPNWTVSLYFPRVVFA